MTFTCHQGNAADKFWLLRAVLGKALVAI